MAYSLKEMEAAVDKGIGAKLIMHLVAEKGLKVHSGLSTGSLCLNDALSGTPNIGFGWGRVVEIYGPESSGKTTLALHCVAEAQKLNYPTMYIDAEHACDPEYMAKLGINLKTLSFVQPDFGEQALDTAIEAIKAGYRLIVIDSVAALIPEAELQGKMGAAHVGRQARMMGQAIRKSVGIASKGRAIIIYINQIRMKVGVMFGNPEITPGGNALKFAASYRVEIRSPRGEKIQELDLEEEKSEIGTGTNVKIVKNKVYPPFRSAKFHIIYGKGIDKYADAVEYLERKKIMNNGKIIINRHSFNKKKLILTMRTDPKIKAEVISLIKEHAHVNNK